MAINEFQKFPTDKVQYDKNYLRLFGEKCMCKGKGYYVDNVIETKCLLCEINKQKPKK